MVVTPSGRPLLLVTNLAPITSNIWYRRNESFELVQSRGDKKMKEYRCKKCNTILPDEAHLKIHESVHKHAKSRIVEYGDPEFSKDRLR